MDAIAHIEVAVRTRIAYHHSQEFGPFGYATEPTSLPGLKDRSEFLARVDEEVDRSRETFVEHFQKKYGPTTAPFPSGWPPRFSLSARR